MRCLNLRAATLHYITWHLHDVTDYLRTPVRATGGGWCDALGTESTCRVTRRKKKKRGWNAFWGRKGTTLTLIIHCHSFHWLAPFSSWRCIIWGNQLLLCFLGSKRCHAGSWCYTLERRSATTRDTGRALRLTLIFVPSSSGSGSGIISIWEHRKQQKERESVSKVTGALEPL